MERKLAVLGVVLAAGVAAAVSSLVAQAPAPPVEKPARPRVMMLDGRGAQLGVMVDDLSADELKTLGSAPGGVRIEEVDQESPAAKAGLREGDIVIEVDGDRVRSARQFSRLIQETPAGRSVALGIVRDGQRQSISVTPEARAFGLGWDSDRIERDFGRSLRELEPRLREIEPRLRELEPRLREFRYNGPMDFNFDLVPGWSSPRSRLGVQLEELTPQLAEYFGAKIGGVLVSSIHSGSPAEKAGLKAGDVITSINGDAVRDSEDVIDELRAVEGQDVTIGILREKKESSVKATLEARPRTGWRRPA
jgi:serine protease Do